MKLSNIACETVVVCVAQLAACRGSRLRQQRRRENVQRETAKQLLQLRDGLHVQSGRCAPRTLKLDKPSLEVAPTTLSLI